MFRGIPFISCLSSSLQRIRKPTEFSNCSAPYVDHMLRGWPLVEREHRMEAPVYVEEDEVDQTSVLVVIVVLLLLLLGILISFYWYFDFDHFLILSSAGVRSEYQLFSDWKNIFVFLLLGWWNVAAFNEWKVDLLCLSVPSSSLVCGLAFSAKLYNIGACLYSQTSGSKTFVVYQYSSFRIQLSTVWFQWKAKRTTKLVLDSVGVHLWAMVLPVVLKRQVRNPSPTRNLRS